MLVYLFELIASCVYCCMMRTTPRRGARVHEVMDILEELSQEEADHICAMHSAKSCC